MSAFRSILAYRGLNHLIKHNFSFQKCNSILKRNLHASLTKHKKYSDEELGREDPVAYSRSKARDYSSTETFISKPSRPKSQPFIIMGSLAVFMVYFFYLREENDLDELIYRPLEETITGSNNEEQIKVLIKSYKSKGLDTKLLERRLKELQQTAAVTAPTQS